MNKKIGWGLLVASSAMALVLPQQAVAQSVARAAEHRFDIPAQPLSAALMRLSRETGIELFYTAALTDGKTSQAVRGQMSPIEALSRLLRGTGLTYKRTNARTITLEAEPATGASAMMLDAVRVDGSQQGAGGTDGGKGGRGGQAAADAPYRGAGSRAYLSERQIEERRGTSVADFLSGIPGVMSGDSRNAGALDVNIRGMQGEGRVPVIVDGASQETTIYRGYNGAASRTFIDPDFIGSVSIEKGPSAGADATGATGGVVRMSTIRVGDIILPGQTFGVRVKGAFNGNSSSVPAFGTLGGYIGNNNGQAVYAPGGMNRPGFLEPTGWAGSVAVGLTTAHVDLVAAYARRKNGNYHAGGNGDDAAQAGVQTTAFGGTRIANVGLSPWRTGEEVLNTSTDNVSWLVKANIKLDDHSLELGWNRYDSQYGEIFPTILTNTGYPFQGHLNSILVDTYTARYHWKPDSDLIDLKVDAFKADVDLRINSVQLNYVPSTGASRPTNNNFVTASERLGVTLSNTSRIGSLSINYGGAWTRETIGYPEGYDTDNVTWSPRQGRRREMSGFAAAEWKALQWLTLNGSLRYQHFETLDETDGSSHSNGGWSPLASITVEPIAGVQFYTRYAGAIRSPSVYETLKSDRFAASTQNFVDPERSRNFEAGFNVLRDALLRSGDKLRIHAAYFDNHIDNYITRSIVAYTEEDFSFYRLYRINLKHAIIRGVEVSAGYDLGPVFADVAWNHYTHTMFCVKDSDGLSPIYSRCAPGGIQNSFSLLQVPPRDTLSVTLGTRLLENRLKLSGRMNYVGKRIVEGVGDGVALTTYEIKTPVWNAYTLFDLNATYDINKYASVGLAVDNLTDRYYLDALSGTLVAGPGRTLRGNFTFKF